MQNYISELQNLLSSLKQTRYPGYKVIDVVLAVGQSYKEECALANSLRWRVFSHQNFTLRLNDGEPLDMSVVTEPEDLKDFPIWKFEVINIDPVTDLTLSFVVAAQVPTNYPVREAPSQIAYIPSKDSGVYVEKDIISHTAGFDK